jgi:hypothetical protein
VTRLQLGVWNVTMGDLASQGVTHASALSTTARNCTVEDWGPLLADEVLTVDCFDRHGNRADAMFVVSYLSTAVTSGKLAYAWANDATSPSYALTRSNSFNSTGNVNSVQRDGTGNYRVFFPDFTQNRGTVLVSKQAFQAGSCRAVNWSTQQAAMVVRVKCYDVSGVPEDSKYFISFMQGLSIKGVGGTHTAYLWANHPTTASYHSDAAFRFSTAGSASTVTRSGVGRYLVDLPGMPTGGAALVTPTGNGKAHCNVSSIRFFGTPQHIGVRCFKRNGDPVDAPFALSYGR